MKKYMLFIAVALLGGINAFAQNCANYLVLQNNKKVETTVYNKKGKETGRQNWTVTNASTSGNTTKATVTSEYINQDGKSLNKSTSEVKCTGGVLQVSMKMMFNEEQVRAWGEDAIVTATGEYLDYPSSFTEGATLPDGLLQMKIKTKQGLYVEVELSVKERTVQGKESITSAAGTWECYKISSKQRITNKVAGIGMPINYSVTEWFAPGVGIIKTESRYGSTLVTSIQ